MNISRAVAGIALTSGFFAAWFAVACGGSSGPSGTEGKDGSAGTSCDGPCAPGADPSAFDACGGKIVSANGKIDAAEYAKQALAADLATIDCRLGVSFTKAHPGAADDRPLAYQPPRKTSTLGRNGASYEYELGGPPTEEPPANERYGSVNNQVLYTGGEADDPGLARVTTYDWGNNTILEHPEPVWWGVNHPKGRNTDPAVDVTYNEAKATAWSQQVSLQRAFTMARSTQTWSNDALVVFKPGFFGATGTQTSACTYPTFVFPKNKVVMALSVTSANELTLVAVWDTDTQKGQVAVLANLARGMAPTHSWPYFGLPNAGSYTAFKLMGYVDLPFATPTAISAAANADQPVVGALEGNWAALDKQSTRDEVRDGPTQIQVATAGYAVVASRWESKVAFIDLQAIFAFLRERYLTTDANYKEASVTAPAAWPYTFDSQPTIIPKVVKVIDVPYPTAVLAGGRRYTDDTRVHVAQLDGTLTTYAAPTLGNADSAKAEDITVMGTVNVGASPTTLAWPRSDDALEPAAHPFSFNPVVVAVSRAERQISWVATSKEGGSKIYRRFRDKRLEDPVDVDFNERAYVATVADFAGKKVLTYRFGKTPADHLAPDNAVGMGADGKADVECGGELSFPGSVFMTSSTNVN
ncbi:MAG: hypothetical protein U0174_21540 [Polyangiaceae bacterium]